jgi:hypothetical protein
VAAATNPRLMENMGRPEFLEFNMWLSIPRYVPA